MSAPHTNTPFIYKLQSPLDVFNEFLPPFGRISVYMFKQRVVGASTNRLFPSSSAYQKPMKLSLENHITTYILWASVSCGWLMWIYSAQFVAFRLRWLAAQNAEVGKPGRADIVKQAKMNWSARAYQRWVPQKYMIALIQGKR